MAWPEGLKGMKATRFDHCLLYGDDIDGTADLLQKVLGFQLAEQVIDQENNLRVAAFLTVSMKAHDIAFGHGTGYDAKARHDLRNPGSHGHRREPFALRHVFQCLVRCPGAHSAVEHQGVTQ